MLKPIMTEMLVNTSKLIIENSEGILVAPVTVRKDDYSYLGYYGKPPRCYEKEPVHLQILKMLSNDRVEKAHYIIKEMGIDIEKEFIKAKKNDNMLKDETKLKNNKDNSIEPSFQF